MIFVIDRLKYDTDKMEKVADIKKWYPVKNIIAEAIYGEGKYGITYDCELWRSKNGNWLVTHKDDYETVCGEAIKEKEAKNLLMKANIQAYEKIFGPLEEA